MPAIRAIFWDVGGVLLSNAWDHTERAGALERFHLDTKEFQERHDAIVAPFECGQITLDDYLDQTVFYRERSFTREEFRNCMFSLSKPLPGMLEFAQALSDSSKYAMSTINNESRELNNYRIEKFGMREIFSLFISSCYVGLRKPDREIYRLALEVTQIPAEQCCFIDDRPGNLKAAAELGINTIQRQTLQQLEADLQKLGISAD